MGLLLPESSPSLLDLEPSPPQNDSGAFAEGQLHQAGTVAQFTDDLIAPNRNMFRADIEMDLPICLYLSRPLSTQVNSFAWLLVVNRGSMPSERIVELGSSDQPST